MASPVNLSDFETLFDPNRKPLYVGKSKEWWYKHGKVMTEQSAFVADSDCRGLVGRVMELQRDDYWRQFNDDWGEFCLEAFGRPAEWIEQVVEGVRVLHLQEPSRLEQPVPAAEVIELKSHGGDRRSEDYRLQQQGGDRRRKEDQGADRTLKRGSESADYIKARLRRDHPEIAEELEQGQHRSARAAGIAAGFIKDVPTVRLSDPGKAAASIKQKMGDEWAASLAAQLTELLC